MCVCGGDVYGCAVVISLGLVKTPLSRIAEVWQQALPWQFLEILSNTIAAFNKRVHIPNPYIAMVSSSPGSKEAINLLVW